MKVLIMAGLPDLKITSEFDYYVGVDAGARWLFENKLPLDLAVGDFDSISESDFQDLENYAAKIVKLQPEKDQTDLEVALNKALEKYPSAEIEIYGALGGRLDHELTNVFLPISPKFLKSASQISLVNQRNQIYYLTAGHHKLKKIPSRKYIGFMQINSDWSLEILSGAKYPLKKEQNFADIYASNEFLPDSEEIDISFTKGQVLVIYSND